jgi:hypothetical protein
MGSEVEVMRWGLIAVLSVLIVVVATAGYRCAAAVDDETARRKRAHDEADKICDDMVADMNAMLEEDTDEEEVVRRIL